MNIELFIIPLIFILSFFLIWRDFRMSILLLLVLSIFLHKEVFSIYKWDVLPVRIFMLALLAFGSWQTVLVFRSSVQPKYFVIKVRRFFSDPFVFLLTLLWAVRGISLIFSKNLQSSIFLFGFFTTILSLGLILYTKYKSDSTVVLRYIKFYLLIIFIAGLFSFVQLAVFYNFGVVIGAMWPVPGNIPRVGATFWDVNHFAGLLASLMPILGALVLVDNSMRKRVVNALAFLVLLVVLLLTNSRTAWMLAFFSFISFVGIMLYKKYKHKGVLSLVLVIVLFSTPLAREYSIKSSPFRAKVKDYFHYRIDSFDSHILLLRGTAEVFEEKPILGGGYGSFFEHFSKTDVSAEYFGRDPAALNTRVPAHTIWGELLSETGILGLSSFVLLMTLIMGTLYYCALTLKDKKQALLTTAMFSSLVGWMIAGIFYSYKAEFFWIIVFLYFIYAVSILGKNYDFRKIIKFFACSEKFLITVIVVLSLVLIFWKIGANHLIPWDEAIYAEIAKKMVISGDIFEMKWKPYAVWFEKPPLYVWMTALSMKFFGFTSFAARLPSAIFGFATILLTYYFGKKLYSRVSGFISAFVLLTTFQFLYYSRTAMIDVTVTFFITLSLYMYWISKEKQNLKYWVFAGVASGFAVMTKGVIGLLPFLVVFLNEIYLFRSKRQNFDVKYIKKYIYMFGSSALIFLPWHLEMYRRFGIEFINSYLIYHVFYRATSAIEDKGRPFYWYLIVLKVSMRTWFLVFLAAFPLTVMMSLFGNIKGLRSKFSFDIDPKNYTFLLLYSLSIFVFFSIATSKLVWYIMPVYPALAIIVGIFLARIIEVVSKKDIVKKFILVFILFVFGIFYFFVNRELVYISDLTGKQAQLLQLKDKEYGIETKVYADRIELPLIIFYSNSPYEVVDIGPLNEIMTLILPKEQIIFITKESRFRKLKESHPEIDLVERFDEWVLAERPELN